MQHENNKNQPIQNGQASITLTQESTPTSQGKVVRRQPQQDETTRQNIADMQNNVQNAEQITFSESQQDIPYDDVPDMKSWSSPKQWTDAQWQQLVDMVENDITGEELMKAFGFKRRKDLEVIFYHLSERNKSFYKINWLADYEGGAHALPDLKSIKGGLNISYTRFARHGYDVKPNTFFEFKRISDTEIRLTIVR